MTLFKDIEYATKNKLKKILSELRGFKFLITLGLVFKKIESDDKTKYYSFHSSSKTEIIIIESDIDDVFKSNLYHSYIEHTKTFRKRFRLDY